MNPDIFGIIAAILTTAAFIPQVIKVHKERDTSAISLGMYSIFTIGVFFWLIYGLCLASFPMITANIITFTLACYILWMKIRLG